MRPIVLPPPPEKRVIAFDESVVIHGYSAYDLEAYGRLCVEADRIQATPLWPLWERIRASISKAA
jgi:hypothetical protein